LVNQDKLPQIPDKGKGLSMYIMFRTSGLLLALLAAPCLAYITGARLTVLSGSHIERMSVHPVILR